MEIFLNPLQTIKHHFNAAQAATTWQGKTVHYGISAASSALLVATLFVAYKCAKALFAHLQSPAAPPPRQASRRQAPQLPPLPIGGALELPFQAYVQRVLMPFYGFKTLNVYLNETLIPRGLQTIEDVEALEVVPRSREIVGKIDALQRNLRAFNSKLKDIEQSVIDVEQNPKRRLPMNQGEVFDSQRIQSVLVGSYNALLQLVGGQNPSVKITEKNWKQEIATFKQHIQRERAAFRNGFYLKPLRELLRPWKDNSFPHELQEQLNILEQVDDLPVAINDTIEACILHRYILQQDIVLAWRENLMPQNITTLSQLNGFYPDLDVFQIGINRHTLIPR